MPRPSWPASTRRGVSEELGLGAVDEDRQLRPVAAHLRQPGDVVGIKVNPNGQAGGVISSPELLHAIVAGLNSAGIPNRDIVVYERYRNIFNSAGIAKWLPEGVRSSSAAEAYDSVQQGMDGYDPDH